MAACQGPGRTVVFGGRATAVTSQATVTITSTVSTDIILQCVEIPPVQGPNWTITRLEVGDIQNIVSGTQTVTGGTAGTVGVSATMFSPYATCTNIVRGLCVGVGVPVALTAVANGQATGGPAQILEVAYQGQASACGLRQWDPALTGSPKLGTDTGSQIDALDLSGRIKALPGQASGQSPRGRVVAFGQRVTAVTTLATVTIALTVSTPLTLMCVEIPPEQGAYSTVTQLTVGDITNVVNATNTVANGTTGTNGVSGTMFSPYATCTNVVRGLCVGTGVPVTIAILNQSLVTKVFDVGYTGITSNC